ncbi:RmlC-like cupin domain-containing protein [Trichoderma longibrachiatum]|uniref:RmlC-like cupin n=1 Tax=Trichoderma longibrachiatum ATCC 18648 TaxID=983965 RepID=A0A2T4BUE0_TRILO|nr:RmlC-like cupin [Trichoderma longibrachiatum ATCC 18648]
MSRFSFVFAIFVASISTIIYFLLSAEYRTTSCYKALFNSNGSAPATEFETVHPGQPILGNTADMSKSILRQAKITPHLSSTRGHNSLGWLDTYHSFSFAHWHDPRFTHFGSLRVLNEDRVQPNSGFPTHPHRDFEIFSYILSGELTHRDSMLAKGKEGGQSDKFFRMHRGDVQFTTGGTGIAHSEFNEHDKDTVHFLQIWAIPWKRGLTPRYHTRHFSDEDKRKDFVKILSPLKAGEDATAQEEAEAEPTIPNTIPIHADFVMGAGIIAPEGKFEWKVGGSAAQKNQRKVFVHLPMLKGGKARIRLDGREDAELSEGDGAFVEGVYIGDRLIVESIGEEEAEVIVLDTA